MLMAGLSSFAASGSGDGRTRRPRHNSHAQELGAILTGMWNNCFVRFHVRVLRLLLLLPATSLLLQGADSCFTIHGRAHLYGGDGQLRIWHIGTHHEYQPDESSWAKVEGWLEAGIKDSDKSRYANPASMVYLFADFVICPTEPLKKGSVQTARVMSAQRRRYVPIE